MPKIFMKFDWVSPGLPLILEKANRLKLKLLQGKLFDEKND